MITIHAGNAAPVLGCVCGCPGLPVWGSRFFVLLFSFLRCSLYKGKIGKNSPALLPVKEYIGGAGYRQIVLFLFHILRNFHYKQRGRHVKPPPCAIVNTYNTCNTLTFSHSPESLYLCGFAGLDLDKKSIVEDKKSIVAGQKVDSCTLSTNCPL